MEPLRKIVRLRRMVEIKAKRARVHAAEVQVAEIGQDRGCEAHIERRHVDNRGLLRLFEGTGLPGQVAGAVDRRIESVLRRATQPRDDMLCIGRRPPARVNPDGASAGAFVERTDISLDLCLWTLRSRVQRHQRDESQADRHAKGGRHIDGRGKRCATAFLSNVGINAPSPRSHREIFRPSERETPPIGRVARGTPVAPSSHMPHAVLNGRDVSLPDAPTLADALRAIGVHLPALCHDERLEPTGACRLCLVRLNGAARPVPACGTPVTEGMTIDTSPPDLEAARRGTLQMLAAGYPAEAARADPDKPFHQEIAIHGLDRELGGQTNPARVDRSHPFITVDMSRCIQCGRCVRICDELQGQFVWHLRDRGADVHIEPDGPDLLNSSCVSCGACVDTCPTGALEDATFDTLGGPSTWTRTVCPYCGTGCELAVGTRDGAIVSVKPQRHSPVSKGHLCVKGRYAFEFVSAGDRIVEPMIREDREWRRVSWDEALSYAADGLRRARDSGGADAVGVLASARQTNEENYLTQKFARIVAGTNNVDCCARVCHMPSSTALKGMLGSGLSTNSFDDIEHAGAILVFGANATENHPIVGARIKQAARRRGAALIVVDPRRIELAEYADVPSRLSILARISRCSTRWRTSSSPSTWSIARSSTTA